LIVVFEELGKSQIFLEKRDQKGEGFTAACLGFNS
jgi:hypothetical protein